MKLTVYYDGQFWVGVIEVVNDGKLRAIRHLFGQEPKDSEIMHFVNNQLLQTLSHTEQEGVCVKAKSKKLNPKRLQRQASKEMKNIGISTKAQKAIKQELEARKEKKKQLNRKQREKIKEQKYLIRKQKAKEKHRGKQLESPMKPFDLKLSGISLFLRTDLEKKKQKSSPSRDEEGFSAIYLNSLTSVNESVSIDERFDEDIYGPKTANAVKRFQSMCVEPTKTKTWISEADLNIDSVE